MSPKNELNIHSMKDVYQLLDSTHEDDYEEITQKYQKMMKDFTGSSLSDLKKAYKAIRILHGVVDDASFNDWYSNVANELSKLSSEFELYDDTVEQISIIDYMEPELFLDAYLQNNIPFEFSNTFHTSVKVKDLLEEANENKLAIDASLQRMRNLV